MVHVGKHEGYHTLCPYSKCEFEGTGIQNHLTKQISHRFDRVLPGLYQCPFIEHQGPIHVENTPFGELDKKHKTAIEFFNRSYDRLYCEWFRYGACSSGEPFWERSSRAKHYSQDHLKDLWPNRSTFHCGWTFDSADKLKFHLGRIHKVETVQVTDHDPSNCMNPEKGPITPEKLFLFRRERPIPPKRDPIPRKRGPIPPEKGLIEANVDSSSMQLQDGFVVTGTHTVTIMRVAKLVSIL
jgi:hypothetical protein